MMKDDFLHLNWSQGFYLLQRIRKFSNRKS